MQDGSGVFFFFSFVNFPCVFFFSSLTHIFVVVALETHSLVHSQT